MIKRKAIYSAKYNGCADWFLTNSGCGFILSIDYIGWYPLSYLRRISGHSFYI